MADVTNIQIESGTYSIKDAVARDDISALNTDLTNYKALVETKIEGLKTPTKFFSNKKFILIGDSYGEGYTPDGNINGWPVIFNSFTGLTNTIVKVLGGTGFVNLIQNKNFQSLLEEVTNDDSVSDIVVLGGYNDIPYNQQQIYNAINSFVNKAKEKFPNANIYLGAVGWTRNSTNIYPMSIVAQRYKEACGYYQCYYLNGIEYSLHNYFADFSSDGFHPNLTGQTKIARNLVESLVCGSCNNPTSFTQVGLSYASNVSGTPFGTRLTVTQNNNVVSVHAAGQTTITLKNPITGSDGYTLVEIGTINNGYIVGTEYDLCSIPVQIIVNTQGLYYNTVGVVQFMNGKMYLKFADIRDDLKGYRIFSNISSFIISSFSATFDALYC